MKYLFVLGRDPALSVRELLSYCKAHSLKYTIEDHSDEILVIDLEKLPKGIIDELGGTVKIAELITKIEDPEELDYYLGRANLIIPTKEKLTYAISNYNSELLDLVEEYLKSYFKSLRIKALYKKELAPSKAHRRNILEEGLELILFKNYVGKTIQISNVDEIKRRDIGRPDVDVVKTISIRLAKMMLNIGEAKVQQTLLDPFCGSGTILQEALLRNMNVLGVDLDKKSIEESKKNLEWLTKNYPIKYSYKLFNTSSTTLSNFIRESSVDIVVTEPIMGPYWRKLPYDEEVKNVLKELVPLYRSLFEELHKVLKPKGKVVIILPTFRTFTKTYPIDVEKIVRNTQFRQTFRELPYYHPSSKVRRNIFVFEKL